MGEKKLHAIMIAFCYQGHTTPFINLAMKLASNGCAVTFVHTEFVHHMVSKADGVNAAEADPFVGARESGLDIRYATISDGLPPEFDRILYFDDHWDSMYRHFPSRMDELVGSIIRSDDECLHFLVADTFYSWPAAIASKYSILNVSFWTEPALVFSIDYHLDVLRERGYFPIKGDEEKNVLIDFIEGVEPIKSKDLMSYFHDPDVTSTTNRIVWDAFVQVKHADFILINTVHELEHQSLSSLNQKQPTYAIGPINFTTDFTKSTVPKSLWPQTDCKSWLDSKPPSSVLYLSFGSLARSDPTLAAEIAHGLLLSGTHFVWVIRGDGADVLPRGFENDVEDRGLVVSWCNQNAVLSHPATGGFLTHCGWNSILESLWCGVPMICHPFFADQPTNRKLVVDDWKVGINLCDGASVDRREVGEKIKQLMSGESSKGLRGEMERMRSVLHKALDEQGSTEINFQQFLKDLWAKAHLSSLIK